MSPSAANRYFPAFAGLSTSLDASIPGSRVHICKHTRFQGTHPNNGAIKKCSNTCAQMLHTAMIKRAVIVPSCHAPLTPATGSTVVVVVIAWAVVVVVTLGPKRQTSPQTPVVCASALLSQLQHISGAVQSSPDVQLVGV